VVVASDLPVHREIYADAAEYFSPYCATQAATAIARVIAPSQAHRRQELVALGAAVSKRYLPDALLPQWAAFLAQFASSAHKN
jgi:hypothetical protein